jgi:hypothetical protein
VSADAAGGVDFTGSGPLARVANGRKSRRRQRRDFIFRHEEIVSDERISGVDGADALDLLSTALFPIHTYPK